MPLDIGVGILLALGVGEYFGIEVTPALVVLGIAAALLPDLDIVTIPLLGKWYHRTVTHFPLVYVPLVAFMFYFLEPQYATLITLGILAHLIHDTFGIGYGIAWLWPFSRKRFLLCPSQDPVPAGRDWVTHYYFRPNKLAYIEYGVLLVALVSLAVYSL